MTFTSSFIKLPSAELTFYSVIKLFRSWLMLSIVSLCLSTCSIFNTSCCFHSLSKHLTLSFPFSFIRIFATNYLVFSIILCSWILLFRSWIFVKLTVIIAMRIKYAIVICICWCSLFFHIKRFPLLNKYFFT